MITKASFDSFEAFAAWAEDTLVPTYFGACENDSANSTWTAYKDAGKTQIAFKYDYGWTVEFTAYKSASVSRSATGWQGSESFYPDAWMCSNGIMLDCLARGVGVIFTKNNRGETVTVINDATNTGTLAQSMTSVYCTAYGDDPAITSPTQFHPISANQTQFVPFCSDAPYSVVSYTPNAFYMPQGQFYSSGMSRFSAGSHIYLTNGYWAILDS